MSEVVLGKRKHNVEIDSLADDVDNHDLSDDSENQIPEAHRPMTFQLPYRGRTINEQDAQSNPRGVSLHSRIVFNDKYATKSFDIPAHQGQKMSMMLQRIQEMFPQIRVTGRDDIDDGFHPSSPNGKPALFLIHNTAFLLQETTYKSPSMRRTRWSTSRTAHRTIYRHWYNRNVIRGTAPTLTVEVRLWTAGAEDRLQLLGAAGRGEAHMDNEQFLFLDMQHVTDENGLRTLLCTQEVEPMTIPVEPGTLEVFPALDNEARLSRAIISETKAKVNKRRIARKKRPRFMRNINKRLEKMQILDQDEVDGTDTQLQTRPAVGGVEMDIDG